MKFFILISKVILSLYLAKYIAGNVLIAGRGSYMTYALFVAISYMLFVPWKYKLISFCLLIMLPFTFPRYFPMFQYWSEIVAPVLFFLYLMKLVIEKKPLVSKKAAIFFAAVGVLALWTMISYIKTPVAGVTFGASSKVGLGLRNYMIILTCINTFFLAFWCFRDEKINAEKALFVLLIIVLVLGNLRLFGFSIPLLGKYYSVQELAKETTKYSTTGGLRIMALMGVSTVFSLYYKKRLSFLPVFVFINSIVFSVFSGGRAMFFGILFAISLYFILLKRKHIIPLLFVILLVGSIYSVFLSNISVQDQRHGRIFALEGGLKEQNIVRYYYYLFMWEVFLDNPVFGKGLGYATIAHDSEFFLRHEGARKIRVLLEQGIASGSHGSYMSILSIFGIGGFFFITVMNFGTVFYAYRIVRRSKEYNGDAKLALFIFMYVSIMSVHMITGGMGYDYRDMWFLPGIIAAILARNQADPPETLNIKERKRDLEYQ